MSTPPERLLAKSDQATKVGAQAELVQRCRLLLRRLTTEVEIGKAAESFPKVRLPIEVLCVDVCVCRLGRMTSDIRPCINLPFMGDV